MIILYQIPGIEENIMLSFDGIYITNITGGIMISDLSEFTPLLNLSEIEQSKINQILSASTLIYSDSRYHSIVLDVIKYQIKETPNSIYTK
jgi:hypothetical protein